MGEAAGSRRLRLGGTCLVSLEPHSSSGFSISVRKVKVPSAIRGEGSASRRNVPAVLPPPQSTIPVTYYPRAMLRCIMFRSKTSLRGFPRLDLYLE